MLRFGCSYYLRKWGECFKLCSRFYKNNCWINRFCQIRQL